MLKNTLVLTGLFGVRSFAELTDDVVIDQLVSTELDTDISENSKPSNFAVVVCKQEENSW